MSPAVKKDGCLDLLEVRRQKIREWERRRHAAFLRFLGAMAVFGAVLMWLAGRLAEI